VPAAGLPAGWQDQGLGRFRCLSTGTPLPVNSAACQARQAARPVSRLISGHRGIRAGRHPPIRPCTPTQASRTS